MIFLTYLSIALLTLVLLTTLFNAFTAPMLRKTGNPRIVPVSILIPARDEAHHIHALLEGLSAQAYPNLEILVMDDHSSDGTAREVLRAAGKDHRIRLLSSKTMPAGWTGKNWACHQLSQAASGDILIFTDADNRHAPQAVSNTIARMQTHRLGLLSAFPQQNTVSLMEKLVIPVIDLFVYSTLPLWMTYWVKSPLFAAANGQWIAFTREAYHQIGGHAAVAGEVVEDVELSRLAKRKGISILLTAGTGMVFCRMYQGGAQVWEGFSKNLFGIAGYKIMPFAAILGAHFMAYLWPFIAIWHPGTALAAAIAIAMNLLIRTIVSLKYRHPLLESVLLHPLGIFLVLAIGLNSVRQVKSGFVRWKGREIPV